MSKRMIFAVAFLVLNALAGCNEEEERFEEVNKLRALGVASEPVAGQPSTETSTSKFTLTFHAAVPVDETVTAEPFIDEQSKYALPLLLTLLPNQDEPVNHSGFRLYTFKAEMAIPPASALLFSPEAGFARLRYGMRLSSGAEEEKVVGTLIVYPEGSEELAWQAPTVDIKEPTDKASVSGTEDLKAEVNATIPESMRVGWYVSGGKVKNRRAKETTWETPGSGEHSILVTARGLKSGAFAYKVYDVTVE